MSKDTLTTILGAFQAGAVALITFISTAPPDSDGSRWTNPVWYLGLVAAVLVAIKAYFTKGTDDGAPKAP